MKTGKSKHTSSSTLEAEANALCSCTKSVMGVRMMLKCVGLYAGRHDYTAPDYDPDMETQDPAPMAVIFCDNQGTLDFVASPVTKEITRHIAQRKAFMRYRSSGPGQIATYAHIGTEYNEADIGTKALERVKFERVREALYSGLGVIVKK